MAWHRAYYSVIQYCPDLGRLEAANVGVIVFCPELHYLKARVSRNNERIRHFFGSQGHDWGQINTFKSGLQDRITHAQDEITDAESFRLFVGLQANLMQLTTPLPCKVTSYPDGDLDRLFDQIVGVEKKRTTNKGLKRELSRRFEKAGISDRIRESVAVTVPVLEKRIEIPFAFQNGRLNLLTPARFEAQSVDSIVATACRYAVEGESLYEAHDNELGKLQLAVVGKFRASDQDGRIAVERILREHHVKLYRFDRVPELVDEIRRTAKSIPHETDSGESV